MLLRVTSSPPLDYYTTLLTHCQASILTCDYQRTPKIPCHSLFKNHQWLPEGDILLAREKWYFSHSQGGRLMDWLLTSFFSIIFSCPLITLTGQKHEQTANLEKKNKSDLFWQLLFLLTHVLLWFYIAYFLYSHILPVKLLIFKTELLICLPIQIWESLGTTSISSYTFYSLTHWPDISLST